MKKLVLIERLAKLYYARDFDDKELTSYETYELSTLESISEARASRSIIEYATNASNIAYIVALINEDRASEITSEIVRKVVTTNERLVKKRAKYASEVDELLEVLYDYDDVRRIFAL